METLSIHERINIKDNSNSNTRKCYRALTSCYGRISRSKNASYSRGATLICDAPYFSYETESFRKISDRFDGYGNLTHKWLLNHPEVHHLIFFP